MLKPLMKVKIFSKERFFNYLIILFIFLFMAKELSANTIALNPFFNSRENSFSSESYLYQYYFENCFSKKDQILVPNSTLAFWNKTKRKQKINVDTFLLTSFFSVIQYLNIEIQIQKKDKEPRILKKQIQTSSLNEEISSIILNIGENSLANCKISTIGLKKLLFFFDVYQKIWSNTPIQVQEVLRLKDSMPYDSDSLLLERYADIVIYLSLLSSEEEEKKELLTEIKNKIQLFMRKKGEKSSLISRLAEIYFLQGNKLGIVEKLSLSATKKNKTSALSFLLLSVAKGVSSGAGKESLAKARELNPNIVDDLILLDRYNYLKPHFEAILTNVDDLLFEDEINIPLN